MTFTEKALGCGAVFGVGGIACVTIVFWLAIYGGLAAAIVGGAIWMWKHI